MDMDLWMIYKEEIFDMMEDLEEAQMVIIMVEVEVDTLVDYHKVIVTNHQEAVLIYHQLQWIYSSK